MFTYVFNHLENLFLVSFFNHRRVRSSIPFTTKLRIAIIQSNNCHTSQIYFFSINVIITCRTAMPKQRAYKLSSVYNVLKCL